MASELAIQLPTRTDSRRDSSHNERFPGDDLSPDQITTGHANNIFHIAAKYHESCSQKLDPLLPEYPLLPFMKNAKGDTALHIAARLGKLDFVTSLVRHADGIPIEGDYGDLLRKRKKDKKKEQETPPLLRKQGDYRDLLRRKNRKKNTALHEAVQYGHLSVAKFLVDEDPILSCFVNEAGESPLFLAMYGRFHEIAEAILEKFPNFSISGGNHEIARAFVSGRNGMIVMHAAVIRHQPSDESDKPEGDDVIMKTNGYFVLENVLRTCGADILHVPDEIGWMPHHYAAKMGKSRIVRRILQADSFLAYIKDEEGMSALHIAAREGYTNVIETLIQECPCVCELLDKRGRTALHVAVEHGQVAVIRTLMKTKAFTDLANEQDDDGNTALHLACILGHVSIINCLITDRRTNKRTINNSGMTAIDIMDRSSRLHPFDKTEIRLKLKEKTNLLKSLKGAAAVWNQTKEEQKIISTEDSRISQPNAEAHVKQLSENSKGLKESMATAEVQLLVSTIIASITFAAGMTMPGGYDSSNGLAILRKDGNFRWFLVFNSLAFGFSIGSMLIHLSFQRIGSSWPYTLPRRIIPQVIGMFLALSTFSCIFAYCTGTKAVLSSKKTGLLHLGLFFGSSLNFSDVPGNIAFLSVYVLMLFFLPVVPSFVGRYITSCTDIFVGACVSKLCYM